MDYNKLAELIFPDITGTVDDLEARFPKRDLPEGAKVTRFAPSPTGYMHIGGLYAAMISRKLAKQSGGVFYLRIEDTDRKRELENGVEEIINSLNKFDLGFDEGPFEGSPVTYAPYKQSERKEIYQICVKKMMQEGYAYPDFTTAEELDAIRAKQEAAKVDIGYYGEYAVGRNLTYEQIEEKLAAGEPYVVRLKSPGEAGKTVVYSDPIRGKIEMPENMMDVVLLKSDGIPTYHFAHAVDDHFMRTNMVIRGDEWLASYPLHKQLFELCGFELPEYAHISPIMKMEISVDEDGNEHQHKRKLSKRKDPEAAVGFYQEQGYPSESVLEYLMTIANSNYEEWHAANPDKKLYEFGTNDKESFLKTISLWKMSGNKVRKDVGKWSDLAEMFGYLYVPEDELKLSYEIDEKYNADQMAEIINEYKKDLFLDAENWFAEMKVMGDKLGYCPNVKEYKKNPDAYKGSITDVCTIVRVAVTGKKNSPDLATIMNVIGKNRTIGRLDKFLAAIGK